MYYEWYESIRIFIDSMSMNIVYYCNLTVALIIGSMLGMVAGAWIVGRSPKRIYLVTTIHIGDPASQHGWLIIEDKRRVGWYPKLEGATEAVKYNDLDIYEMGSYDHCLIEEVVNGLYPTCPKEWWFRWEGDIESGGYKPVSKPHGLENTVNFGIG